MASLPGIPILTQEQCDILETCPRVGYGALETVSYSSRNNKKGQLVRITAAAGAGKTTTLLALAVKAVELGHKHITYVTFTTAAATDGKERLDRALAQQLCASGQHQQRAPPTIDARTLHSCAHKLLQQHHMDGHSDVQDERFRQLWNDKRIKRWISDLCRSEIEQFLQPCFDEIAKGGDNAVIRRNREDWAKEQVEFFIYKSLIHFCQSNWSLEVYQVGLPYNRDYYPATLFHSWTGKGKEYGFSPNIYKKKDRIGFSAEKASDLWNTVLKDDIRSFDLK